MSLINYDIIAWHPRVVHCMVLLAYQPKYTKILNRMINVLKSPKISIICTIVKDLNSIIIQKTVKLCNPKYILQLSMDLPLVCTKGIEVIQTFDPDHLAAYPKDKANAYKQLLLLKYKFINNK